MVTCISQKLSILSDIVQSEARQRPGQYKIWQNGQFEAYNLLRIFVVPSLLWTVFTIVLLHFIYLPLSNAFCYVNTYWIKEHLSRRKSILRYTKRFCIGPFSPHRVMKKHAQKFRDPRTMVKQRQRTVWLCRIRMLIHGNINVSIHLKFFSDPISY